MTPTLDLIRSVAERAASSDTAAYKALYERSSPERGPLLGHCHALASWVQSTWGGRLVVGRVPVAADNCHVWHWWNELPDGHQVDFMSDYFGGDGLDPVPGAEDVSMVVRANVCPAAYAKRNRFRARADEALSREITRKD